MDIFRKELFVRLFPLDIAKIRQLAEEDRDSLINIFREVEKEIRMRGLLLQDKGFVYIGKDLLAFSCLPYVEIIEQNKKDFTDNDIDSMNMILYRTQYKFPFNLFIKPILPKKYCIGDNKVRNE